jgi:ADP-dependent NAD(P)H-hydrate dehydratase / NAD(P)H-hydrate epimerase
MIFNTRTFIKSFQNLLNSGDMAFMLSTENVKATDAAAIKAGIPLEVLVEAAGRAVADAIKLEHPNGARVVVVCGKGLNGADGFACARWLCLYGFEVKILHVPLENASEIVKTFARATSSFCPMFAIQDHLQSLEGAEIIVDALLGVGFSPPLRKFEQQIVQKINLSRAKVWAVDLPSGMDANVPQVASQDMVHADHTVTFTGFKPALLFNPTREMAGQIELVNPGIPTVLIEHNGEVAEKSKLKGLAKTITARATDAHKGTSGRVFILGGLTQYPGAPALAARAAFRAGAGLVTVVAPDQAGRQAPVEATRHTITNWNSSELGFLRLERTNALAFGMGVGEITPDLLELLLSLETPMVLDADALQPWLIPMLHNLPESHPGAIITPHPGEAARMLETTTPEILKNPLEAAKKLARQTRAVVVLKGGPSVVAGTGLWVNSSGNPGMATGGMGDVLSGVLAALIAQAPPATTLEQIAQLGVYIHGLAGDLAASNKDLGLLASEVADFIPVALKHLR